MQKRRSVSSTLATSSYDLYLTFSTSQQHAIDPATEVLNKQDFPSSSTRPPENIMQQIQEHTAHIMSDDANRQLSSTQQFRRLLSIGKYLAVILCANAILTLPFHRAQPTYPTSH